MIMEGQGMDDFEDQLLQGGSNKTVRNLCPLPCQKVIYKAQKRYYPGLQRETNNVFIWINFGTMNIENNDEVWILETYNFIGTVGGSLGLFIGFSYTGFFGQIIDYLFFRNN